MRYLFLITYRKLCIFDIPRTAAEQEKKCINQSCGAAWVIRAQKMHIIINYMVIAVYQNCWILKFFNIIIVILATFSGQQSGNRKKKLREKYVYFYNFFTYLKIFASHTQRFIFYYQFSHTVRARTFIQMPSARKFISYIFRRRRRIIVIVACHLIIFIKMRRARAQERLYDGRELNHNRNCIWWKMWNYARK